MIAAIVDAVARARRQLTGTPSETARRGPRSHRHSGSAEAMVSALSPITISRQAPAAGFAPNSETAFIASSRSPRRAPQLKDSHRLKDESRGRVLQNLRQRRDLVAAVPSRNFTLPEGLDQFEAAYGANPRERTPGPQTISVYRAAETAISGGAERTHLRFILSQTSSDCPDNAMVRGSGQRVTPRSARKRSMTLNSAARHSDWGIGNAAARRGPACLVVISERPIGCGLQAAAAARTMICEARMTGVSRVSRRSPRLPFGPSSSGSPSCEDGMPSRT